MNWLLESVFRKGNYLSYQVLFVLPICLWSSPHLQVKSSGVTQSKDSLRIKRVKDKKCCNLLGILLRKFEFFLSMFCKRECKEYMYRENSDPTQYPRSLLLQSLPNSCTIETIHKAWLHGSLRTLLHCTCNFCSADLCKDFELVQHNVIQ